LTIHTYRLGDERIVGCASRVRARSLPALMTGRSRRSRQGRPIVLDGWLRFTEAQKLA